MKNESTTHNISIEGTRISIHDVTVESAEAAQYISRFEEDEWGLALDRLLDVGAAALSRASGTVDIEFMRRQADAIIRQIQEATGKMPEEIGNSLKEQIGVEDGQALAPIKGIVDRVQTVVDEKLKEVRKMLDEEIDPSRESSTVAKTFRKMEELLDSKRSDSIPGTINAKLAEIAGQDGDLAKLVKTIVEDSLHGVKRQISDLNADLKSKEDVDTALRNTTAKGLSYEEGVVAKLAAWGNPMGIEVEHVGADNKAGDVIVTFPTNGSDDAPFKIVVEAKDRTSAKGRAVIAKDLANARALRFAEAAVFVSKTADGLAKEIGDFAEGEGLWVACTDEHLTTAVRLLKVQHDVRKLRSSDTKVDTEALESQIERIRTAMNRIKAIKMKVTVIRSGADGIQTEAEALRDEVREALGEVEAIVRTNKGSADASS